MSGSPIVAAPTGPASTRLTTNATVESRLLLIPHSGYRQLSAEGLEVLARERGDRRRADEREVDDRPRPDAPAARVAAAERAEPEQEARQPAGPRRDLPQRVLV